MIFYNFISYLNLLSVTFLIIFLFEKHAKMRIELRMWQNDGIVDRKYKAICILSLETYINNLEKHWICYLTDFITPNSKIIFLINYNY